MAVAETRAEATFSVSLARRIACITKILLAAAAALMLVPAATGPASAAEVPKRKAGLWELSTVGAGTGTLITKACIDGDDSILAPADGNCSAPKVTSDGVDTTIVDVICEHGSSKQTISGAFTGNFDARYRAQVKMTFDPPPPGMSPRIGVTIDGKYLGPDCPSRREKIRRAGARPRPSTPCLKREAA